ncbi:hypothetical protein [Caballeronia insecticola]|uniref:Uncharacterized protein n=1 Tax=Caballeronia insecticola TaxID=758793 RepID=R4WJW5_9BURK|nr:hypothetical protein [Caballeronia insecticola]BAN24798.1 putative uncharacterized protein [Caballeronia insecticola]
MSFPEWGHSYNALYVPLQRWGWQCALMPAGEVKEEASFNGSMSFEEREKKRRERKKQIEQDKDDFDRLFRAHIDPRDAATSSEFRHYADFIRNTLRMSRWNMPIDGDGITRSLRDVVRARRIIPVIDRAWYGGPRVFRHYAPQHWPGDGGGGFLAANSFRTNAPTGRFTGPFAAAMFVADTVMNSRLARSSRAIGREADDSGSGFNWLDAVESTAGVVLGDGGMADDSGGPSGEGGSLFGDAQPFEYESDMPDGDVFDLASQKTKTPNLGDPGQWYTNPGSGQMRLYGDTGAPVIDLDFDHRHNGMIPHAHNWNDGVRDTDDDVVPFSPWNP